MKTLYNTDDNIYLDKDMLHGFRHAMHLAQAGTNITAEQAFKEWKLEYHRNTLKKVTLDAIASSIAIITGLSRHVLLVDAGRSRAYSKARHILAWFAYLYVDSDLYDIAMYIGYNNHSSVNHAFKTINDEIRSDDGIKNVINAVKAWLVSQGYELTQITRHRSSNTYKNTIA